MAVSQCTWFLKPKFCITVVLIYIENNDENGKKQFQIILNSWCDMKKEQQQWNVVWIIWCEQTVEPIYHAVFTSQRFASLECY